MTKWLEGWDFWQTRQLSGPGGNKPRRKVFCGMGKTMNDLRLMTPDNSISINGTMRIIRTVKGFALHSGKKGL
jgi:hypothetical protein